MRCDAGARPETRRRVCGVIVLSAGGAGARVEGAGRGGVPIVRISLVCAYGESRSADLPHTSRLYFAFSFCGDIVTDTVTLKTD